MSLKIKIIITEYIACTVDIKGDCDLFHVLSKPLIILEGVTILNRIILLQRIILFSSCDVYQY